MGGHLVGAAEAGADSAKAGRPGTSGGGADTRQGLSDADVRVLQQYLRHCAAGTIPPGPWDEWIERDPRDAINVERARLLAQGRDEMPPAMLKAIGFG